jgi:hypothetical protein
VKQVVNKNDFRLQIVLANRSHFCLEVLGQISSEECHMEKTNLNSSMEEKLGAAIMEIKKQFPSLSPSQQGEIVKNVIKVSVMS